MDWLFSYIHPMYFDGPYRQYSFSSDVESLVLVLALWKNGFSVRLLAEQISGGIA
jgi:hypothetical protein